MKTRLALLMSVCCLGAAQQAPRSSESGAAIFGRVLDAETHEVVRRTAIKIYTAQEQWDEFADGEGLFHISENLIPGDYTLIAHRDGYTDRTYKMDRSAFEHPKELLIEVHRQGVITGRVVDDLGQERKGATIQALGLPTAGKDLNVAATTDTNDLGEYRLSGLDPGTYQVRASYREGRASEFDPMPLRAATSYYGGSERPTGLTVKVGLVLTGIDFVLNPLRPVTVRGALRSDSAAFADPATLWIMGLAGEGGHDASARNGKFEIRDVGPGNYTISAQTLDKTAPLFGLVNVEVRSTDLEHVDIDLRPTPKIEAEIRVEGGRSSDFKLGLVYFNRIGRVTALNMEIGHPDSDGNFSVALVPGEYSLAFDASITNLGIRSASLDGEPITGWKIRINESSGTKKLIITLASKP